MGLKFISRSSGLDKLNNHSSSYDFHEVSWLLEQVNRWARDLISRSLGLDDYVGSKRFAYETLEATYDSKNVRSV